MTASCPWLLMLTFQENVCQWEQADPLWVLLGYVHDFSWDLTMNNAWIAKGGPAPLATVGATNEVPLAHPSDDDSKVVACDGVLLLPWQVVPKVQLQTTKAC